MNKAIVVAITASGGKMYYTGKAGADYVSHRIEDAFDDLSVEEARRKALQFNKQELGSVVGTVWHAETLGDE